jgi:hypothetical protein
VRLECLEYAWSTGDALCPVGEGGGAGMAGRCLKRVSTYDPRVPALREACRWRTVYPSGAAAGPRAWPTPASVATAGLRFVAEVLRQLSIRVACFASAMSR